MTDLKKNEYLEETLVLLIRYYGRDRVAKALAKIAPEEAAQAPKSPDANGRGQPLQRSELSRLKDSDPDFHAVLIGFKSEMDAGRILPEAEDVRRLATMAGLKHLNGKSRRDLIPKLLDFLAGLPRGEVEALLVAAGDISDVARREGYSVLTDKLLGDLSTGS